MKMKEKVIPVILAGGNGSRLWPISRKNHPKQFFNPDGNGSLLIRTLERAKAVAVNALPLIVISAQNAEETEKHLEAEKGNYELLKEPFPAGTAAAVAYAAVFLQKREESGILVMMPADHCIPDLKQFCNDIRNAVYVSKAKTAITVLGIKPRYPATGFGYAEEEKPEKLNDIVFCRVKRFVEKPRREKARRYIKKGTYLWNSGITVCPLTVVAEALSRNFSDYEKMLRVAEGDWDGLTQIYRETENISFDCSVLEKEKEIYILRAGFPWHDMGTFQSLAAVIPPDSAGNVRKGNTILKDVNSSVIVSDTALTAVIGVRDMVVVNIDGIVLVCPRRKGEEVRDIVAALSDGNEKYK